MYCDGIPLAHLANPLQLCCCSVAVEIFQNWDFLALERRPLGVTLPLVYWYIAGQSVEMATLVNGPNKFQMLRQHTSKYFLHEIPLSKESFV